MTPQKRTTTTTPQIYCSNVAIRCMKRITDENRRAQQDTTTITLLQPNNDTALSIMNWMSSLTKIERCQTNNPVQKRTRKTLSRAGQQSSKDSQKILRIFANHSHTQGWHGVEKIIVLLHCHAGLHSGMRLPLAQPSALIAQCQDILADQHGTGLRKLLCC